MRTTVPSIDLTDRHGPVTPGDEVEIWCRSLGSWSSGFEAVDLDADGWQVLRRSDGSRLPVRFTTREVRRVPLS